MIKRLARHLYRTVKFPLSYIRGQARYRNTHAYVERRMKDQTGSIKDFDFIRLKDSILQFAGKLQINDSPILYRYSNAVTQPTLYSSAYICLTYSLLGELKKLSSQEKQEWIDYFDSFQRESDGLFYDNKVHNEYYDNSDWWGARHQALHMVNAYSSLGSKPKYPLRFLEAYYDLDFLKQWMTRNDDKFGGSMDHDFDNKLMNVSCLLQYQRDTWKDEKAGAAVKFLQEYLLKKINPQTGIWGDNNVHDPVLRSRKVQFAYHLFPLFFYDNIYSFDSSKIIDIVLQTQNAFGGYAPAANSSACEDIDSIDILIRLSKINPDKRIHDSLAKAFKWILCNQMQDGGFVFKLNEPFTYGHEQLSSSKNTGAVFPTWFRTLSLAYLSDFFNMKHGFNIVKCPGYEF